MDFPKIPDYHDSAQGTDSSPEVWLELLNNPITYEIILMIAVVAFAILMANIFDCCRSRFDTDSSDGEEEEDYEDEEEAQPWNLALTVDGYLFDNASGGRGQPRQYGMFYRENGKWHNADGRELNYNEWIQAVYDPLD